MSDSSGDKKTVVPCKISGSLWNVVLPWGAKSPITQALKKVLPLLLADGSKSDAGETVTSAVVKVGLTICFSSKDFEDHMRILSAAGCGKIIVSSPCDENTLLSGQQGKPVQGKRQLPDILKRHCVFVGLELNGILTVLAKAAPSSPGADCAMFNQSDLARILQARKLYEYMKQFGHGVKDDITNAFLAPARTLAEAGEKGKLTILWERSRAVRNLFRQDVIDKITKDKSLYVGVGADLVSLWNEIETVIINVGNGILEARKMQPRRLMTILTEIRVLADEKPPTSAASPQANPLDPIRSTNGEEAEEPEYRILVIDDNATDWREVFQVLADTLSRQLEGSVVIEFSTDATSVQVAASSDSTSGSPVSLWQLLPEYDVVLLDLYLPWPSDASSDGDHSKPYGLAVLERIRSRLMRLPVIVWTSSVQAELPAKANLANGFLFKKSTTLEAMAETLEPWMKQGRAKRGASLLNPFFDHVIRSEEYRSIALDFTQWALKTMDGLHALDDCYFRFFNDHGGRHLNGDLCNLEKLVRPVLFVGEEGKNAVFSEEAKQAEREMLWLYVATICHDTGMFPLPCEKHDMTQHRPELLGKMRSQHALRALALLNCPCLASRPTHSDLDWLMNKLGEADKLAISLIAAFHSRSSKPPLALALLNPTSDDEKEGIPKCSMLALADEKDTGRELELLIKSYVHGVRTGLAEDHTPRLDRLSALLRMADGIDIDHTRLPTSHILRDPKRSIKDDCENFKRQVLDRVEIDRGTISLRFRLPLNDDSQKESKALNCDRKWVKRLRKAVSKVIQKAQKKEEDATETKEIPAAVKETGKWIAQQLKTVLENAGDKRYCPFSSGQEWSLHYAGAIADAVLEQFFGSYGGRPKKVGERVAVSILAALAVCSEVLERYQGIKDVGLNDILKLGEVTFEAGAPEAFSILDMPPPYVAQPSFKCISCQLAP